MKGLTDIPGITVGHASDYDGLTGCTAILCESGAVAGVFAPGSATGTEEFELMRPTNLTERIHAVLFAGGSAFGLEAASGVRRILAQRKIGFPTSAGPVPLVVGAVLFDLPFGNKHAFPTREMGEVAATAASNKPVGDGAVGAGTGATVGKLHGMSRAMKSGIGSFTCTLGNGVQVAALAAVNAFGDVIDPGASGAVVAGARSSASSTTFVNTAASMIKGVQGGFSHENTTLVAVATDALLTKTEANKLAQLATLGMARTISPVWTMYDGDSVIALSAGQKKADINALGVAAAEAVSQAILRAVRLAPTMGGVPGLKR